MYLWWLENMKIFYENIRFSKTHSEYQEQPYLLEKTTIVLLDPPKKMHVTFIGYLWNIRGIFLHSIFPEHYLGIFPGILQGTFSEYSGNISWECSKNIPRKYICPVCWFLANYSLPFLIKMMLIKKACNWFFLKSKNFTSVLMFMFQSRLVCFWETLIAN